MSDAYIKNRHGIAHSIPEEALPVALAQGAKKISKSEFDKLMAEQQPAQELSQGETEPEPDSEPDDDKGKAKK